MSLLILLAFFQTPPLHIGSKSFTESVLLGEIIHLSLVENGFESEHTKQLGGSRILWNALIEGEIDAYPEYTGTMLRELFADNNITSIEGFKDHLASQNVSMSAPLGFNNTYALGMRASEAKELGIKTISDLSHHPDLKMGFSNEFMQRGDGWPGLKSHYNLPQKDVLGMDHDLSYRGLESGSINVIDIYSTDAEIEFYDLVALEDDQGFFPRYDAVILYRNDIPEKAKKAITDLGGNFDEKTMAELNSQVKIEGIQDTKVAADFLGIRQTQSRKSITNRIFIRTSEHLYMVAISLFFAIIFAIPLGILACYNSRLESLVMNISGALQTIPSLALLVVMIPLFGIGYLPAIVALFLYSLLPIVRNTHQGITSIPKHILESAEVLGLSENWILRKISLPLAAPSILAGIKTAAVINVGTATLGALIGAGGYGQPILTGIRLDSTAMILEGAIPAALLALGIQWLFELIEAKWFRHQ